MTYAQLESLINKWSLELEDQEKHFLHQATQVNAWDRTLIENGEKVRWQPAWFCWLSLLEALCYGYSKLSSDKAFCFKLYLNYICIPFLLNFPGIIVFYFQITSLHREVEKVKLDQKR